MVVGRQPSPHDLDQLFGALADATRRDILARVMDADASVSELAARYEMSFAAVQKHVAVLERAQLVTKRKDGRAQRVAGNPDAVRKANRLLAQFEERWLGRVARLDALLDMDTNAARRRTQSHIGDTHARGRHPEGHQGADDDGRRPIRRPGRPRVGRLR
jgi:DNA-binding transcriptional ArsR family regulator